MARPKRLDRPVVISFAISSTVRDRLASLAQASGVKLSELLRGYVGRALEVSSGQPPSKVTFAQSRLKEAEMLRFEWLESEAERLQSDLERGMEDLDALQGRAKKLYNECVEHLKVNTYLSDKKAAELSNSLRALLATLTRKRKEFARSEES